MTALQQVSIAPVRSFWLQQALAAESEAQSAEPLAVDHVCDICIVGGGYTGLWTALRLKSLDPTVSVTVVEADICGGGASGRNGGLVLSWWAKFKLLLAWYGEAEAIRLATATASAIDEMDDFLIANQIDAHVNKGGILRTAAATAQIGKIEPTVVACEQRGIDVFQRLTANEVAQRAGSSTYIGGVYERQAATVQPALLARGLRRVALQCGVQIFEQTPVIEILGGVNPRLRTGRGVIRAEKVLLATNAWMANLPEIRRAVVVLSSDMVVTAPISGRLKEAGWNGGECITDGRLMVHYHQVTREGRIAIGKGSGALSFSGEFGDSFSRSQKRADVVAEGLRYLYPQLSDVPVTHLWAGPIDRTRNALMIFDTLRNQSAVTYGIGYSGTGVAPSIVVSKVLASRLLDRVDEWTESPLNRGAQVGYPPFPAKYIGGIAIREIVRRKEEGEQRGRRVGKLERWISSRAAPVYPEAKSVLKIPVQRSASTRE